MTARLDVHALQGDRPGLKVTDDEAPQPGPDGDAVDDEERRPFTGWTEHDRSHQEPERSIDV
ncbi:MAG: hypothetical protein HGA66_12720, partial [Holophaga sp.]|nr:hypothetical protein [Holophaga sp.]